MKSNSKRVSKHSAELAADWQKIKNAFSDTAVDITGVAEEIVSESCEEIKDKTANIQKSVTDYTTKKPLKALGIAAVIGFAIGYWIKR